MTTRMEYAQQPVARCLERMGRTADEVAAAIDSQSDVSLSRRPGPTSWSAKEVVANTCATIPGWRLPPSAADARRPLLFLGGWRRNSGSVGVFTSPWGA